MYLHGGRQSPRSKHDIGVEPGVRLHVCSEPQSVCTLQLNSTHPKSSSIWSAVRHFHPSTLKLTCERPGGLKRASGVGRDTRRSYVFPRTGAAPIVPVPPSAGEASYKLFVGAIAPPKENISCCLGVAREVSRTHLSRAAFSGFKTSSFLTLCDTILIRNRLYGVYHPNPGSSEACESCGTPLLGMDSGTAPPSPALKPISGSGPCLIRVSLGEGVVKSSAPF